MSFTLHWGFLVWHLGATPSLAFLSQKKALGEPGQRQQVPAVDPGNCLCPKAATLHRTGLSLSLQLRWSMFTKMGTKTITLNQIMCKLCAISFRIGWGKAEFSDCVGTPNTSIPSNVSIMSWSFLLTWWWYVDATLQVWLPMIIYDQKLESHSEPLASLDNGNEMEEHKVTVWPEKCPKKKRQLLHGVAPCEIKDLEARSHGGVYVFCAPLLRSLIRIDLKMLCNSTNTDSRYSYYLFW